MRKLLVIFLTFLFPMGIWELILGYELNSLILMLLGWGAFITYLEEFVAKTKARSVSVVQKTESQIQEEIGFMQGVRMVQDLNAKCKDCKHLMVHHHIGYSVAACALESCGCITTMAVQVSPIVRFDQLGET